MNQTDPMLLPDQSLKSPTGLGLVSYKTACTRQSQNKFPHFYYTVFDLRHVSHLSPITYRQVEDDLENKSIYFKSQNISRRFWSQTGSSSHAMSVYLGHYFFSFCAQISNNAVRKLPRFFSFPVFCIGRNHNIAKKIFKKIHVTFKMKE